ncbi:unnamed protein product [Rotaria sp. Silwood2]|nr:unnamed protein product [Rotaria sp. Silwood2]
MKDYLNSFQLTDTKIPLPIFRILIDCVERWRLLQDPQTISVSSLQATIKHLPPGCFLPLYFHAQNAVISIEIDKNNSNQSLISSWQVLLPTEAITSSLVPCLSCFPVTTYRLNDRSQLISKAHCELLMDFMLNTIEYSKSYKNFRNVDETRDVPESHYVCQWWVQQLQGIKIESNSNKSCRVKKKHRDRIRWNNAALPFRRSVLIRMEIWVESYLEQWISRLSVLENETNRFEILLRFYEEYQSAVLNHCWPVKGPTDPIGYSRFILMSLTIIRVIHEKLCNEPRFERLALHSIDIPNLISLLEFLVLPTCEDMIRARDLYDHFYQLNHKLYPDLLKNIESADSFGVYSAALLNEFATTYWAAIKTKRGMNEQWKKRNEDIYDGWYDCRYESRYISIDCIKGTFLFDGMTIGLLPEKITSNELFVRVFCEHIFEVQAAKSSNTDITKHSYHGDRRIQYEFHFNDQTECLTITERHIQTNEIFELIPHNCFETELPDMFVSDHSHWWNAKDQTVEFRPVHFNGTDFLNNKPYILSIETGYIITTEIVNTQILVNQSSAFFENLFNRYFIRLDDKSCVYMMIDNASHFIQLPLNDIIIHIHLSRLRIAFKYNSNSGMITSREYSDMCIDENQWLGTLTGLISGLLLATLPINNHRLAHYPYRKLIVPFGQIHGAEVLHNNYQTITIQRKSFLKKYLHHYFF